MMKHLQFFLMVVGVLRLSSSENDKDAIQQGSYVNLANQGYTTFPKDFLSKFQDVQHLDLSGNKISSIEREDFELLTSLKELNLSNNLLSSIEEEDLVLLNELQDLYLDGNKLRTLKKGAFVHLQKLKIISLHGNPIVCDSSILWISAWLKIVLLDKSTFCVEPVKLAAHQIKDIDANLVACDQGKSRERRNVPGSIIVQYYPKEPLPQCGLIYYVSTNMTLEITGTTVSNTTNFYVNNASKESLGNRRKFWYQFAKPGDYELKVTSDGVEIWKKNVQVKALIANRKYRINFLPKDYGDVSSATEQNITFFLLQTNDQCLTENFDGLIWTVDGRQHVGSPVIFSFDKVGSNSKTAEISVDNSMVLTKFYMSLYDRITGLQVSSHWDMVCVGKDLTMNITVLTGTAVTYSSEILPSGNLLRKTGSFEYKVNLTSPGNVIIRIKAKNVVSEKTFDMHVQVIPTSNVVALVLPQYVQAGVEALFEPKGMVCGSSFYRWLVNGDQITGWIHTNHTVPAISYKFKLERTYELSLSIMYHDNKTVSNSTTKVFVEKNIEFTFPNETVFTYVGMLVVVKPSFFNISQWFQFRWLINDTVFNDWDIGSRGDFLSANFSFLEEGDYNVSLEAKNNVSQAIQSLRIVAQNPITDARVEPQTLFSAAGKEFSFTVTSEKSTIFSYHIVIKNEQGNVVLVSNMTKNKFIFKHQSNVTGIKIYSIELSDNTQTFIYNVTIVVKSEISSLSIWQSQKSVLVGKSISFKVNNISDELQPVNITWYSRFENSSVFVYLGNGVELQNVIFNSSGNYTIMLSAKNLVSSFKKNFTLHVAPPSTILLTLTAHIPSTGQVVLAPSTVSVLPETSIQYSVTVISEHAVTYAWYLRGKLLDSVTSDWFTYKFAQQGRHLIAVRVSTAFTVNMSSFYVYVQKRISNISIIVSNENNTVVTSSSLNYTSVYYLPSDASGVAGIVSCLKAFDNVTFYNEKYSNGRPFVIDVTQVHGEMSCSIRLFNMVSLVTAFYKYYVGAMPVLAFTKVTRVIRINQNYTFTVSVVNSIHSTVFWTQNDILLPSCSDNTGSSSKSCLITFPTAGLSVITASLNNSYFTIQKKLNVSVHQPALVIVISPLYVKVGQPTKITAYVTGPGSHTYLWHDRSSRSNQIVFTKNEAGKETLVLTVENEFRKKTVNETVIAYNIGKFSIAFKSKSAFKASANHLYIPVNESVHFYLKDFDNNARYEWDFKGCSELDWKYEYYLINVRETDYIFDKVSCIRVHVTEITPLSRPIKDLEVTVVFPIEVTLPHTERLLVSQEYVRYINWTGTVTHSSIMLLGVQTYVISNQTQQKRIKISFVTNSVPQKITLKAQICGFIHCISKVATFQSISAIQSIDLVGLEKDVKANSSLVVKVENALGSNITWTLVNSMGDVVKVGSGADLSDLPLGLVTGRYRLQVIVAGEFVENGKITQIYVINVFQSNCDEPTVDVGSARKLIKSKWFYSEINITSSCSNADQHCCYVSYLWEFERADGRKCSIADLPTYHFKLRSGIKLIVNAPILEIPPRAFDVGEYCVRHTLTYAGVGKKTSVFRLTVVGTPLVPIISGGSYRVVGDNQTVLLDASESIDPDAQSQEERKLLFSWNVADHSAAACFIPSPVNLTKWSVANKRVNISRNCLKPDSGFNVKLMVKRKNEEKSQQTMQKIDVISGVAPLLVVECISCNAYKSYKYIQSKKLKLSAHCLNCESTDVTFEWDVIGENSELISLSATTRLSPEGSPALVLDKDVLDGQQGYYFNCIVRDEGLNSTGVARIFLENNLSPVDGMCSISPENGTSFLDKFKVTCNDWYDDDNKNEPFVYWLLAGTTNVPANMSIIYRGIQSRINIQLPLGDKDNQWKLFIQIWVQDSLGAVTIAHKGAVTVYPPEAARDNPVNFVFDNIVPTLKTGAKSNNVNQVMLGVFTSTSFLALKAESSANNSHLLNTLTNTTASMKASSVESVTQIVDGFEKIVNSGNMTDIGDSSRKQSSASINGILDVALSYATEGINLEDTTYNSLSYVINDNINFFAKEKHRRVRRAVDASELGKTYSSLQLLYKVFLTATVAGENERTFSNEGIVTVLSRNQGSKLSGQKYVSGCSVIANIEELFERNDVSSVLESSSIDPYTENEGTNVCSLSLFSDTLSPIDVKDLPPNNFVEIGMPNTLDSYGANSSLDLKPRVLYTALLDHLQDLERKNSIGIHIVVDIVDAVGDGNVFVHFSKNVSLQYGNVQTRAFVVNKETSEVDRTVFIAGSDYQNYTHYYYGIEHDFDGSIKAMITVYTSSCQFWNVTSQQWENTGCKPTQNTTRQLVACRCDHLTSFTSSLKLEPNRLRFSLLTKLDIESNPIMFSAVVVVISLYLIILMFAYNRDSKEKCKEHVIPFVGSDEGFYQYELRVKTGLYPWAGTTAKVGVQIFGTSCTTKVRVVTVKDSFQRNAIDIFRISVDRSIGKIHKVRFWHDNSGEDPSWYLERLVIRSLTSGEKFFFFCNKWIGTDCGDGTLEHEFHVADTQEMKKFSTIFYDVIGRGLNDYHLWLSVFERPKFSKFTRVQRVTCLVTFVLSWMCVNAMWFQAAPDGKVDVYIGFKSYSFEEIVIGIITALMVFPLNFVLVMLFRKAKQKQVPEKKLKIWKPARHLRMDVVDVDKVHLMDNDASSSDEFQFEFSSPLVRRKKKYRDIHELLAREENTHMERDAPPTGDKLVFRTSMVSENRMQPLSSPLTLPLSFDNNTVERLMMSPLHQYRPNSSTLPRKNTGDNLVDLTLHRARSVDSLHLQSTDDELRLMSPRLDPDDLRSHMTDIVEQQLSSILNDQNDGSVKSSNHNLGLPSEYSSSMYQHEAITDAIVRKNEMLAEQLQIPEILELDPCTRWMLPHWCVYIGFALCFIVSVMSAIIVVIYGQEFGVDNSWKWLAALFVGFIEDIFLAYPVLLLLVSAAVALVVKPTDLDKVDHYDFVECPSAASEPVDLNAEKIKPPSGYALEVLQKEGLKRQRFRKFARNVIFQGLLMWFVMGIFAVKFTDRMYPSTKLLDTSLNEPNSFDNISSIEDYWLWVNNTFIPHLYTEGNNWQLASQPSVRQLRTGVGDCKAEEYANLANIKSCADGSYIKRADFDRNWSVPLSSGLIATYNAWTYRSRSHRLYGAVSNYPPGGFEWLLPGKSKTAAMLARNQIEALQQRKWFDKYTRALFHDYVVLNTDSLQYAYTTLLLEYTPTGTTFTMFDVHYFRPFYFLRNVDYFSIFCVLCLLLLTAYMIVCFVREIHRKGLKEMASFWWIHFILMAVVALVSVMLQIAHLFLLYDFRQQLNNGEVPLHVNVHNISLFDDAVMYAFGFLCFLVMLRNVTLLSFLNVYTWSSRVLNKTIRPWFYFTIIHLLVVGAFTAGIQLTFISTAFEYRNFWHSFLSTLFNRWWKSGARQLVDSSYGLGMFWSILWMCYWLFIARNVYKVIVLNSSDGIKGRSGYAKDFFKLILQKLGRKGVKKPRHVHFDEDVGSSSAKDSGVSSGEHVDTPDDTPEDIQVNVNYDNIPPLPYPVLDMDSSLARILSSLDQMVVDEEWEEEMLNRLNKRVVTAKSKPLYSIEKLTTK